MHFGMPKLLYPLQVMQIIIVCGSSSIDGDTQASRAVMMRSTD